MTGPPLIVLCHAIVHGGWGRHGTLVVAKYGLGNDATNIGGSLVLSLWLLLDWLRRCQT